ncbi:MAG: S1 family peptidase, partial [Ferrovibrionaceae bacterium]
MRRLLITAALALGLLPTLAQAQTDNRTLGGDDIPPTRWPIVAALLHGGAPDCGAVLIAESWVVTAAHCVYRDGAALEPAVLSVRFGTELPDSAAGEVVDVAEVVVHKDFSAPTPPPNNFSYFVNDIALLRLGRPVALAPAQLLGTTRAAALAAVGKPATAIGWGTLAEASAPTGTTILKQVAMTVAASGVCATTIAPRPYLAGMLCAEPQSATPAAADATCGGDAGGPLLLPNGRGGFVLAGILSGLRVDCTEPGPAIATAMPDYLDWIVARVPTLIVDGNVVESGFWGIDGAAAAGPEAEA